MCVQCVDIGPPPDSILSMPPPPLPSFLMPRTAIAALTQNDSQPCYAAYMCESSARAREQAGIEFIELPGQNFNDAWLFVVIATLVAIILLITVFTFVLMKCREKSRPKQPPPKSMYHEPHISTDKSQTFIPGDMLFPHPSNEQTLHQQMNKENRLLWATLTPHGTRHVVSKTEPFSANYDEHYEVIDYHNRPTVNVPQEGTPKKVPIRSFDNSGFMDLDYEDMHTTNVTAELYHDDHDSGYQEPHEVIGSLRNYNTARFVSSPTRIEHPNLAPLNMHPHRHGHSSSTTLTHKKSTLSRRTNEQLNYYGTGNL